LLSRLFQRNSFRSKYNTKNSHTKNKKVLYRTKIKTNKDGEYLLNNYPREV
jgi:hypothetical protein